MLDEALIEKRLVKLETLVANLQDRLEVTSPANTSNWLDQLTGSISDEVAFLEALEYGRAYRETDKPVDGESNNT